MPTFALVDCNNFYASCERVFNPFLNKKAIVVLSNNDGCIVARSNEAKKLGIPMGAPFHKWEKLCDKKLLYAFSSNYALYGDMSHRVMKSLRYFCPNMEIYSIDEAFLSFDEFGKIDLFSYAENIRRKVNEWTGIPVSIGIAPTKTLAKIANHIAKKKTSSGVFDLCDTAVQEEVLAQFPIEEIWGIGRNISKRLKELNIQTARELRDTNLKMIRMHFSVVMERLVEELRGTSCIPLEAIQPRQQIMSSRSFGKLISNLDELEEALSHFTSKACVKLRKQNCLAGGINVFIQTNSFRKNDPQYTNNINYHFSEPTNDSCLIIHTAKRCLKKIFRSNFHYKKTGIMLFDLSPNTIKQYDLFSTLKNKNEPLMQLLDGVNQKLGKNTLFIAAEGTQKNWKPRCTRMSQRYTTQWDELATVICTEKIS